MGRHSIQYPEDRLAKVAFLPQKSGLMSDQTAAAWGMSMDPRMMEVDARILGTEDLVYGNKKKINPGTTGAWNLRDTRHLSPVSLNSWAVVSMLTDTTGAQVWVECLCALKSVCNSVSTCVSACEQEFVSDLVQGLERTGIQVASQARSPYIVTYQQHKMSLETTFAIAADEAGKRCKHQCQLLVVMMDTRGVWW